MNNPLWQILDQFGIITGLLTFVVSLIIWYKIRNQTKNLRQLQASTPDLDYEEDYEYNKVIRSENPKALCICLIDTTESIKNDVIRFLSATDRKIKDANIVELNMNGLKSSPESIKDYIQRLREVRRGSLSDATEIHLFMAAPMQASLLAGAVFDNWKPVIIYNKNRQGSYDYWGPLIKN